MPIITYSAQFIISDDLMPVHKIKANDESSWDGAIGKAKGIARDLYGNTPECIFIVRDDHAPGRQIEVMLELDKTKGRYVEN